MSEEQVSNDTEIKAADASRDEDFLLVQYQALVDRISMNIGIVSSNGLRRIIRAFVRAGVHELPEMKPQEKAVLDDLLRMEDTKYALIDLAMRKTEEQAKELAEQKENNNE